MNAAVPFFEKKLALIPGGTEGIGLATASELVSLGADVLVASRHTAKQSSALSVLQKLRVTPAQKIAALSMDVTDFDSTLQLAQSIVTDHGCPDFLINCAGYAHPGYLDAMDISVLRQMMEVNYFGTVNTVKAFLPAMQRAGRGHIVNVSSMAGYLGLFGYTGYCASKYAVIGFSWALRHEVAPNGIAVSVLCPSNTRTPGLERENSVKPKEILVMEEKTKTVDAPTVARQMLKALPKKPFLIHPTLEARFIYWASRCLPTPVGDRLLRRPA